MQFSRLLFMLHTSEDVTEGVAEHSSKLQPSINLHAADRACMFSCSGTDVLSWRDEGLR